MKIGKSFRVEYAWLLWVPYAMFGMGFLINAIVMAANHGQMPVLVLGGDCGMIDADDVIHSCMVAGTHLKFLADWIVINHVGIASPGDFLEWGFDLIVGPFMFLWFGIYGRTN